VTTELYVGVDPGKSGAIVCIDSARKIVSATVMPDHPRDIAEIARLYRNAYWTVEKVSPIHLASAKSSFTFGYGAGVLEGILTASGVSFNLVPPKNWQKVILEGAAQELSAKDRAYRVASRLWPEYCWPLIGKKPHDGVIDAALIALYGLKG